MIYLVIAEKPSVAADIYRALSGKKTAPRGSDHYECEFEGDAYVISSAVGHLLELKCPEQYEVKRGKWTFPHLPVLPPEFELQPIARTAERLKSLAKLLKRSDVGCVINACDAGREGELIFRYIMQYSKCKKPFKRLWLQSMTPAAIRAAFASLRSAAEMQPLADAARSRGEADWLVGINATRAMTAFNSRMGGFFLTTVGRVQTPTLALIVRREEEITAFKPSDYWEVTAEFGTRGGSYKGRWFDPSFKKDPKDPDGRVLRADRIFDKARAEAVLARCEGKTAAVSEKSAVERKRPPQLFDLTSLQREANTRFGFSASTTLKIAQALYEKHKALTYPRTDSRCLPEDYRQTVLQTLGMLGGCGAYQAFADKIVAGGWVNPADRRVFDDKKISDHFAIIPTTQPPQGALTEAEQKIYDFVTRRFLAVFYPPAEYSVTTRISVVGEDSFRTEGKVLVKAGWLEVAGRAPGGSADLAPLEGAASAPVLGVAAEAKRTAPPPRYTEATLLSAMETAGKLVEDEELASAMRDKGLGTPATRASTIEALLQQSYLQREHQDLRPTAKAHQLLALIRAIKLDVLSEPALTGEWEHLLSEMERGRITRGEFMDRIRAMVERIVEAVKGAGEISIENPQRLAHRCPACGGEVLENYRSYACTAAGCGFHLPKHLCGHTFSAAECEDVIAAGAGGAAGPFDDFVSKMGRPFSARVGLGDDLALKFLFDERPRDETREDEDAGEPVPGLKCPKCGGALVMTGKAYQCERARDERAPCDFRVGRVILQARITPEHVAALLSPAHRTGLIADFVSQRTHRPFKAYLVLDAKTGKVGFEFEARDGKPRAARGGRAG
ncbi:MAG: DNA topoisomerase III [Duodenibacillus sp.]|nr:DNA topoisomerase III [Duodenibacillus sp.]